MRYDDDVKNITIERSVPVSRSGSTVLR